MLKIIKIEILNKYWSQSKKDWVSDPDDGTSYRTKQEARTAIDNNKLVSNNKFAIIGVIDTDKDTFSKLT